MSTPTTRPLPNALAPNQALVLHPRDNVATALHLLAARQTVALQGEGLASTVVLRDTIGLCHKFALHDCAG